MKPTPKEFSEEDLERLGKLKYSFPTFIFFLCLRLYLAFQPFYGFIHPDEYSTHLEIAIGKVYNVRHLYANEDSRSYFKPVYFLYIGFYNLANFLFGSNWSPESLHIIPRVCTCFLSFLVDYSLLRISLLMDTDQHEACKKSKVCRCIPSINAAVFMSSSYVMLCYGIRTMTNTVEMILFSLLLFYVGESILYSKNLLEDLNPALRILTHAQYKGEPTPRVKAAAKILSEARRYNRMHFVKIGCILSLGICNNPTFLIFAFVPLYCWLRRKYIPEYRPRTPCQMVGEFRALSLKLMPFVVVPLAVFFDGEKFLNVSSVENFDPTLVYLRLYHFSVSIPMLYSYFGVVGLGVIFYKFYKIGRFRLDAIQYNLMYDAEFMVITTTIVTISVYSFWPNQEQRFMIPLTVPIIFWGLLGLKQLPDWCTNNFSKVFCAAWIIGNLLFSYYYLTLREAGLFPMMGKIKELYEGKGANNTMFVYATKSFPLPVSLLMMPELHEDVLRKKCEKFWSKCSTKSLSYIMSEDLVVKSFDPSARMEDVFAKLTKRVSSCDGLIRKKNDVYVTFPNIYAESFSKGTTKFGTNYSLVFTIYPHMIGHSFPSVHFDEPIHLKSGLSLAKIECAGNVVPISSGEIMEEPPPILNIRPRDFAKLIKNDKYEEFFASAFTEAVDEHILNKASRLYRVRDEVEAQED